MKIKYKPMHMYKLHRCNELDHEMGRPVIFLSYFGQESLIWAGTTQMNRKWKDKSLMININDNPTYFYFKGLQKVETKYLINVWKNNTTQTIFVLSDLQQKQLIAKFSTLTLQSNPYLTINELKENNEDLIIP